MDAVTFGRLIDDGTPESLSRAAALYQGEFLDGLGVRDAAFEAWLKAKAEEYKGARDKRIELRGGAESDNESAYTLIEDVEEIELSYKEEVIDL